jgi:hypothetical protein
LCTRPLQPTNVGSVCAECRLVVRNGLGVAIEECWRDHPDGEHVVSDRGCITRVTGVAPVPSPGTEVSLIIVRTTSEEAREYARAPRIRQGNYHTLTKGP